MVLIAFAIMFGGLGAFSLSGSDTDTASSEEPVTTTTVSVVQSPSTAATTTTATGSAKSTTGAASTTTTTGAPSDALPVDKSVPVRVLNNSVVSGLASKTANQLRTGGWTAVSTGNYGTGTISSTTVYYSETPSEKAAATAIAAQLGVSAQPRFAGIANSPPGVIVIVTSG